MCARGRDGIPGLEKLTGDTVDITEWLDFTIWDRVWYEHSPETGFKAGRWLGVSHRIGSALSYYVLTESGNIISRTTVQHIARADLLQDSVQDVLQRYDSEVERLVNDNNFVDPNQPMIPHDNIFHWDSDTFEPNELFGDLFTGGLEESTNDNDNLLPDSQAMGTNLNKAADSEGNLLDRPYSIEREDFSDDAYGSLLDAEFQFERECGQVLTGRVMRRARDNHGHLIGESGDLGRDTRVYLVKYSDGSEEQLDHNTIAQNIFAGGDSEGHKAMWLADIQAYRKSDDALEKKDGFHKSYNRNKHRIKTTKGWWLLVRWRDDSEDWLPLKDLKESHPIEVAEFALAKRIADEPAFAWWVRGTLKTRNRIVNKVKSRYWKQTHKFGIRLPKTVKEALEIDKENKNTFWADAWKEAIKKEMKTVSHAYHELRDKNGDPVTEEDFDKDPAKYLPEDYTKIKCHIVFDIKLDGNFTRKARFVADGSRVDTPRLNTYSSVVSRESVRIAFLLVALNELDIKCCDLSGAYLNSPVAEQVCFAAGLECEKDEGKIMVIDRALYGLKTSGRAWQQFFAGTLREMGYVPCKADDNVFMKAKTKKNGERYWSYILVYVDDLLVVDEDASTVMERIKESYRLKGDKWEDPKRYLGGTIGRFTLKNGIETWSLSSDDYLKEVIKMVKEMCKKDDRRWKRKRHNPFPKDYRPEMDTSDELDDKHASRYQQLIGILRWATELGRIDFINELSLLSSFNCNPREGHLEVLYRIFEYIDSHNRSRIVFDPTYREPGDFKDVDWEHEYSDIKEEIPLDAKEPLGEPVKITMYADAAHAGNLVTRRSHTGIIIFLNNTPIHFYSKQQSTVEASTFGSEFVALRVGMEQNDALRCKLRLMGVPILGPTDVYCDNEGVVSNSQLPESTLKKKHLSICYHFVRECCAKQAARIAYIPTDLDLADLGTKCLDQVKRKNIVSQLLY